jgi:maleate isomerase
MTSRSNFIGSKKRCRIWSRTIATRSYLVDRRFSRVCLSAAIAGKKLSAKFGVPVAAGLTAEIEALKAMDCKKLVVGTPYEDEINQRLKRYLEASGFEVLQIAGYGVRKNAQLTDLPVHASYKIAKRLYAKGRDADGIFVPCPRWPTITDVQLLEDEIGKPVVTSSLACIWYAIKMIDIKENVRGFGRLMASLGA